MVTEHDIVWDDATIARLWNHHASTNKDYFSDSHGERILKASRLPLGEPLNVLDYGCGPGFLWQHLQRLGARWRYTGLDVSPDSVAALGRRAGGSANFEGAHLLAGLPTKLAAQSYDLAVMIEVVEHLDDARLSATLREIARLLKPGGRLLLTTPNDEDLVAASKFCPECGAKFHERQHVRSWTAQSLSACLAANGFLTKWVRATNITVADPISRAKYLLLRRLRRQREPNLIALFEMA